MNTLNTLGIGTIEIEGFFAKLMMIEDPK